MAAPIEEADSNTEKRESEVLDVLSSAFDPLRALYSRRVQLPCPDILPLNNIAEYDSYSKGESVRQRREQERQVDSKQQKSTHEKNVSRNSQKENQPKDGSLPRTIVNVGDVSGSGADLVTDKSDGKRKLHRNRRTVLTRMEGYVRGPLSVLQRCVTERLLIQVWIRSAVDLRGMCKGYLVAFDKHFNLAMIDVDELYRCPIAKEAQLRKDNKREKRRLKQLREKMALLSVVEPLVTPSEASSVTESETQSVAFKDAISSDTRRQGPQKADSVALAPVNTKSLNQAIKDRTSKSQLEFNSGSEGTKQVSSIEDPSSGQVNLVEQNPVVEQIPSCEQSHSLPSAKDKNSSSDKVPISSIEEPPPPSLNSSNPFIERHVNQLFIRGDNVVSVMILE
ncbi:U7 snRNA-associated Sm-like protein LSm11 [Crassostrea angulata]|uniref:U7 snRNA-associated Sm-like protein LSm11 n=1 Tax=Magallana angulata TaxID=2784310 RepID=UPI0022B120B3|nr:U7 snRNA-associated Sm-like protein LSm11 [Crassostrea angulata]